MEAGSSAPRSRRAWAMAAACGTSRPMAVSSVGREKTSLGVPSMAMLPSWKTTRRSAMRAASSMLCVTSSTVEPVSRAVVGGCSRLSPSQPPGSRPAVGSSRMSTFGRMAMTPAMAMRRFWPPESSSGLRSKSSSPTPTKPAASRTRSSISPRRASCSSGRRRCPYTPSPQRAGTPGTGRRARP